MDQKLCECGCGEPAPIATKTNTALGHKKGQPVRFVLGHWVRVMSDDTRRKMRDAKLGRPTGRQTMLGRSKSSAPSWKGQEASYGSIHEWMRKHHPKSGACEQCGAAAKTDWANVSGEYKRDDISDWRELCKSCHAKFDNWASRFPKSA